MHQELHQLSLKQKLQLYPELPKLLLSWSLKKPLSSLNNLPLQFKKPEMR
jgi:hypothetical protein